MADKEYRKYNSAATLVFHHARVTGEVKKLGENFVKVPTVLTSAKDDDEDMWLDVIPFDGQAPITEYLEKGDMISFEGFPTMQRWGDDNDKVSFTVRNARIHLSPEQIATLKERGYEPGGGKKSKGKPAKKASKPAAKRQIELPPDDDSDGGQE